MIYWLAPRLFQTKLHSQKLAELHFWLATFGIILYVDRHLQRPASRRA